MITLKRGPRGGIRFGFILSMIRSPNLTLRRVLIAIRCTPFDTPGKIYVLTTVLTRYWFVIYSI
jgi:hypothetical protein